MGPSLGDNYMEMTSRMTAGHDVSDYPDASSISNLGERHHHGISTCEHGPVHLTRRLRRRLPSDTSLRHGATTASRSPSLAPPFPAASRASASLQGSPPLPSPPLTRHYWPDRRRTTASPPMAHAAARSRLFHDGDPPPPTPSISHHDTARAKLSASLAPWPGTSSASSPAKITTTSLTRSPVGSRRRPHAAGTLPQAPAALPRPRACNRSPGHDRRGERERRLREGIRRRATAGDRCAAPGPPHGERLPMPMHVSRHVSGAWGRGRGFSGANDRLPLCQKKTTRFAISAQAPPPHSLDGQEDRATNHGSASTLDHMLVHSARTRADERAEPGPGDAPRPGIPSGEEVDRRRDTETMGQVQECGRAAPGRAHREGATFSLYQVGSQLCGHGRTPSGVVAPRRDPSPHAKARVEPHPKWPGGCVARARESIICVSARIATKYPLHYS